MITHFGHDTNYGGMDIFICTPEDFERFKSGSIAYNSNLDEFVSVDSIPTDNVLERAESRYNSHPDVAAHRKCEWKRLSKSEKKEYADWVKNHEFGYYTYSELITNGDYDHRYEDNYISPSGEHLIIFGGWIGC